MKGILVVLLIALMVSAGCTAVQAPAPKPGTAASDAEQAAKPAQLTPVIQNFWANPTSVDKGKPVTLTWSVYGANSVSIDNGVGTVKLADSIKVYPAATTIYKLTARNTVGTVTATDEVVVFDKAPSVPIISWFSAYPSTIPQGGSTVLSWKVNDASRVTLSGKGTVASSGSMRLYPTGPTTYVLEASNNAGYSTDSAVVNVVYMGADVYYETYLIPIPASGSGGYSGADGEVVPFVEPGGGGFSGADGDTFTTPGLGGANFSGADGDHPPAPDNTVQQPLPESPED